MLFAKHITLGYGDRIKGVRLLFQSVLSPPVLVPGFPITADERLS